jgi:hypothetical protein
VFTWQAAGVGGAVTRVAYQGVPGAYSESAVLKACPGAEHLPCDQFELVFQVGTWRRAGAFGMQRAQGVPINGCQVGMQCPILHAK